jgi:hypothetical protein
VDSIEVQILFGVSFSLSGIVTVAKKKKLAPRARKFVQGLAKGMTQKDAAIAAGYPAKNARQSAYQVMQAVQSKMPDLMNRAGLTDDVLIDKYLLPLMNAKETKFFPYRTEETKIIKVGKKETPVTEKVQVIEKREVIAWGPRRDGLELAFRVKGSFSPKTEEEARVTQQFTGPTVIVLDLPRPKRPTQENA